MHASPSSLHPVPADFLMSAGQLLPLQISCWSHSPTAARQTVPFAHWMVLQWSVLSLQSAAVQGSGLSWQVPFPQVSRPSQYRPFEHVAVLFAWVQPVDALQASSRERCVRRRRIRRGAGLAAPLADPSRCGGCRRVCA